MGRWPSLQLSIVTRPLRTIWERTLAGPLVMWKASDVGVVGTSNLTLERRPTCGLLAMAPLDNKCYLPYLLGCAPLGRCGPPTHHISKLQLLTRSKPRDQLAAPAT